MDAPPFSGLISAGPNCVSECAFFSAPGCVCTFEGNVELASLRADKGTEDGALPAVEGGLLLRTALLPFRRPETLAGIVVVNSRQWQFNASQSCHITKFVG